MSAITTVIDKILKNSVLARIFGLRQGFKDKSCPGQENRETRTRFHPYNRQIPQAQNGWLCLEMTFNENIEAYAGPQNKTTTLKNFQLF